MNKNTNFSFVKMTDDGEIDPLDAFMSSLETQLQRGAATVPDHQSGAEEGPGVPLRSSQQQQQSLPLLGDEDGVLVESEEEGGQGEGDAVADGAFDPEQLKNLSAEEVIA